MDFLLLLSSVVHLWDTRDFEVVIVIRCYFVQYVYLLIYRCHCYVKLSNFLFKLCIKIKDFKLFRYWSDKLLLIFMSYFFWLIYIIGDHVQNWQRFRACSFYSFRTINICITRLRITKNSPTLVASLELARCCSLQTLGFSLNIVS